MHGGCSTSAGLLPSGQGEGSHGVWGGTSSGLSGKEESVYDWKRRDPLKETSSVSSTLDLNDLEDQTYVSSVGPFLFSHTVRSWSLTSPEHRSRLSCLRPNDSRRPVSDLVYDTYSWGRD